MKMALVGVGSFGAAWYNLLRTEYPWIEVIVVDQDQKRAAQITQHGERCYTSLEAAIDEERIDVVLNATPPAMHTPINQLAFDHRLPVLCEKPIAVDYHEAVTVVTRARREDIPFAIAENYRYFPVIQATKQLLNDNAIGDLRTINVRFFRAFHSDKAYLHTLQQPLLTDVAIHHLDLIRYLSGSEGQRIFAHSYNPQGSSYPGHAAADLLLDMENSVHVAYSGNLVAWGAETGWHGGWRIEGTDGIILVTDQITLLSQRATRTFTGFDDWNLRGALDDFLHALVEQRQPSISGQEYLKTQNLLYHAEQSNDLQQMIDIKETNVLTARTSDAHL